jgi:hypothetical protein
MSMGSFRSGSRKIDIVEHKAKLREEDPRRQPSTIGMPDIGVGFWYGFRRFPAGSIPPAAPSPGTTR